VFNVNVSDIVQSVALHCRFCCRWRSICGSKKVVLAACRNLTAEQWLSIVPPLQAADSQ